MERIKVSAATYCCIFSGSDLVFFPFEHFLSDLFFMRSNCRLGSLSAGLATKVIEHRSDYVPVEEPIRLERFGFFFDGIGLGFFSSSRFDIQLPNRLDWGPEHASSHKRMPHHHHTHRLGTI